MSRTATLDALAATYAREIAATISRQGLTLCHNQRRHYAGRWVRLNYITRSERSMQAMQRRTWRALEALLAPQP